MNTLNLLPEGNAPVAATARPAVLVREVSVHHRERLRQHFLALPAEDRMLRFGQMVSNEIIDHYVDGIDFERDTVFGVFDADLTLMGVGHLAYLEDNAQGRTAEFGVSVSHNARGLGVGTALFKRAAIHSRNTRVSTLYMHCLSRNGAMMHIAKKAGMDVHAAYGEADAYLTLPPADPNSVMTEHWQAQVADFDYAVKRNLQKAHAFWSRFFPLKTAA